MERRCWFQQMPYPKRAVTDKSSNTNLKGEKFEAKMKKVS